MSSGSYYPKPVRGVEIPKKDGKKRLLGIPTIEGRAAQMVLRNRLEPVLEPMFHEDSYGCRPDKSALDAIATARSRCFGMKWVIEFDIVGLFDNINHGKLLELIRKHCQEKWILLYIERCLKAPVLMPDKRLKEMQAHRKAASSVRCLQIFLCIMHLTNGWQGGFRNVRGKDMQMME